MRMVERVIHTTVTSRRSGFFEMSVQFYLVQRNCDQLFPVDRRCGPSLFGHKTNRHHEAPTSLSSAIPLSTQNTHHFLRALRAVGGVSRWPAEDRGEEQNEDDGHFHLESQRSAWMWARGGQRGQTCFFCTNRSSTGSLNFTRAQCASYTNKSCNESFLKNGGIASVAL